MNKIELPIDGIIDYNEKRKLNVRLRKGENDKLKLELLDNIKGIWGFGNNTLKCHFDGQGYKYNVTFLNCSKSESIYNPEIKFCGYISYSNFKDTEDSTFIDAESLRKKFVLELKILKNGCTHTLRLEKTNKFHLSMKIIQNKETRIVQNTCE